MSTQLIERDASRAGLRGVWTAGDFGRIAKFSEPEAESFISRLCIQRGARVLDVACGTGNLALVAARRAACVWGLDIAPNLLEQARTRAHSEGLKIHLDEGDAERLPYTDASFDLVVSMYGAMFAPRHEKVAAELTRVCRSGGLVAMANWTPAGFVGQMLKLINAHASPQRASAASPVSWGEEEIVSERFSRKVSDLKLTRRIHRLSYPFSVPETVEFFRRYYGPVYSAFENLEADGRAALRLELERLWSKHNRAGSRDATQVEAEYLEVVARRA
jgi:ubiquinone/menaquinone biosynthesis C-methylase UbiE